MEWTTALSLAVRTGKTAYDNRQSLNYFWKKILTYYDKGATNVVVTGHSAAGKSALVAQMHGRARSLDFKVPGESFKVEVDAITIGEWTKIVRVLPGQAGRRLRGEEEAFADNKELEGVIHVVNFGYVSPRDPAVARSLVKDGIDTVEKLRRYNLDNELRELDALLVSMRRSNAKHSRPKWLVIAVNKVDLFPDQRDQALDYYHPESKGAFGERIKKFQQEVGENYLKVYVTQTCAMEENFKWNQEMVETALAKKEEKKVLIEFIETLAQISEIHK